MKKLIIAAVAAICTATSSVAITVDTDKYFAYLNRPSATILLSNRPCSLKDYANVRWKSAWFYESGDDIGIDSCWYQGKKTPTIVEVCFVHPGNDRPLGPCVLASKELFLKTMNLPSRANFN